MGTVRVLVVDDAAQVRQDLTLLLTLARSENAAQQIEVVGQAANGREAVAMAEGLHPEVVLMDLEMPVMDGWEAARQIKARTPACRVIALTVHGYGSARLRSLQAGMDGFCVKGAPVERLVQLILDPDAGNSSGGTWEVCDENQ